MKRFATKGAHKRTIGGRVTAPVGVLKLKRSVLDPDNPPLTEAQLARARPVSRVKRLRWRLNMSQKEFSEAYGIPIGTIRDWEQGRSKPDAPARGLLALIEDSPKRVQKVLGAV